MRDVGQRDDAIELALLDHSIAIDAEDRLQQRPGVDVLGVPVSIQDHAALDSGIENVIQFELARQQIDNLC